MNNCYKLLCEVLNGLNKEVEFIIHQHNPRRGSEHYDLRFQDAKDPKIVHSFALPTTFPETVNKKTTVVKTRLHGEHWLTIKSYRLKVFDQGKVSIKIQTSKYFELEFKGSIINGFYKLFKLKNTFRGDYWILVKQGLQP